MRRDPFQSIADPNRRKIIKILKAESPLTMNALAEKFDISRPAVSKHVKILEKSGVVEIKQVRVERFCFLIPESLLEVKTWVDQFLTEEEKVVKPKLKAKHKAKKEAPAKKKTKPSKKAAKPNLGLDDEEDQLSLF